MPVGLLRHGLGRLAALALAVLSLALPTGGAEPRWFGDGRHARAVARKETVVAEGRGFQAVFRRCAAGGVVVSLPAVPHLMTRGATYQHARVKAIARTATCTRCAPPAAWRRPASIAAAARGLKQSGTCPTLRPGPTMAARWPAGTASS